MKSNHTRAGRAASMRPQLANSVRLAVSLEQPAHSNEIAAPMEQHSPLRERAAALNSWSVSSRMEKSLLARVSARKGRLARVALVPLAFLLVMLLAACSVPGV